MKNWQKIGLLTLFVLLLFAIRIFFLWRERHEPVAQPKVAERRPLTEDEMVQPRKLYIDSLDSAKALNGKTVWVQSGYSLDYYPYAGHRIDFAHRVGALPGAQALQIQDIVTVKVPASLAGRMPHGDKQAFAIFKMPGDADKEYTTAIGFVQGGDSTYYCDQIFYYDDPHQMYKFWGPQVWAAIDQHAPIAGMNELQMAMALGVVQQSESSSIGNRTVDYDADGKKWSVTFANDKATTIKQD